MSTTREAGDRGEAMAAEYLRENGYEILASQFRCRFGEIDLIAWDKDVLCFIEVKTRTNTKMGLPREYVTPVKQSRIRKTALFYLADNDLDCPARFDVAEVYADAPGDEKSVRIEYLKDAFQ
jgi:putative endonuclease